VRLWLTAAFWRSRRSAAIAGIVFPRWVCYLGYLVGLTLLVAAGAYQWTQLVSLPWVLLVSLVIFFDRPVSHESHPAPGELTTTHQPS
jgi:hypothetical protein